MNGIKIREFLYQSIVFVTAMVAIFKQNKNIQLFLLVGVNIFLALVSVFYFNHHLEILNQNNLLIMIILAIIGYGILFLLDNFISKITKNNLTADNHMNSSNSSLKQSTNHSIVIIIRRKSFHIAPVLILPVLAHLNTQLLLIMLSGSFYILFNLELLRYFHSIIYRFTQKDP